MADCQPRVQNWLMYVVTNGFAALGLALILAGPRSPASIVGGTTLIGAALLTLGMHESIKHKLALLDEYEKLTDEQRKCVAVNVAALEGHHEMLNTLLAAGADDREVLLDIFQLLEKHPELKAAFLRLHNENEARRQGETLLSRGLGRSTEAPVDRYRRVTVELRTALGKPPDSPS